MQKRLFFLAMLCLGIINTVTPTAFHDAVESNNIQRIRNLIRDGNVNINEITEWGVAPLHSAVSQGSPELVRELLESPNIDVNIKPNVRMGLAATPLLLAVSQNRLSVVRALLTAENINVNVGSRFDSCLLNVIINDGCYNGIAPASLEDRIRLFAELLAVESIDVNLQDSNGWTPLHHAVYRNSCFTQLLLRHPQIDINAVNNNGNTPLHQIMEPKVRDPLEEFRGIVPSDIIHDREEKKKIIEHLIVNGANPYIRNANDKTAFDLARDNVGEDFVNYLKNRYHNLKLMMSVSSLFDSPLRQSQHKIDRILSKIKTLS